MEINTFKAIQSQLNKLGFGPLYEDGIPGPRTIAAIKQFQIENKLVVDGKVGPQTYPILFKISSLPGVEKKKILNTNEKIQKYGEPGDLSQLKLIITPYPLIIAWDKSISTRKVQCHKLIAEKLLGAMEQILKMYGLEEIERLNINIYGGCYNLRQMRGGTVWSSHAFGIAIDFDPIRNQLNWTKDLAEFAKNPYINFIKAFYNHGFLNLGVEKNFDWMHFEIAG